jgi:hypothetical protein
MLVSQRKFSLLPAQLTQTAIVPQLASLPGVNLTRYHGVFAPNSAFRAQVTPARRGKRPAGETNATTPDKHRAMTWARRLKRVFKIDVEVCEQCGGAVKIIACIERPDVIERILSHRRRTHEAAAGSRPQSQRAPPIAGAVSLFD